MSGEYGSARQEAERLVATVLAMASRSGARDRDDDGITATGARLVEGIGSLGNTLAGMAGLTDREQPGVRHGFATGSVECCVCPVCRTIAGMRNPTPESAARLATGAGDLASGVASMMRAFSAMSGGAPRKPARPAPPSPDPDLAWSAATRAGEPATPAPAADDEDASPWSAATRAAARADEARRAEARDREAAARAEAAAARKAAAAARAATAEARRDGTPPVPQTGIGDVWAAATAPDQEDR